MSKWSPDWPSLLLGALAAVTAAPLFVPQYLPFTDLPEHAAVMSALAHWNDPAFRIAEQYSLVLGKSQYLLYHVVGAALTRVVGDADFANRLLLASVAIAWPFSFRSLLRAFNRPDYLAIFAPLVFWNRALQVGFLPYIASIPLLLWGTAAAARLARETSPSLLRAGGLAVLSVALFYVHVSAYVLFAMCATLLVLREIAVHAENIAGAVRAAIVRLAWILPSALAAGYWWTAGKITVQGESLSQAGAIGSMRLTRAIHAFPLWAHDVFRSHGDEWCAAVYWTAFIVLIFGPSSAQKPATARWVSRISPAIVPLACVTVLYLATPFRVGAGSMLNVRLAPILALFAIASLRAPPLTFWPARISLACVALVTIAMSFVATSEMMAMNREEGADFRAMFSHAKRGGRLIMVNFEFDSPHTHFPPWVHAGAYYRVDRGGVAAFSFSELAHWPLHYRPEARPPSKPHPFWEFDPCAFRNGTDGPYYDYILLRGDVDLFHDEPPGPKWKAIASDKSFRLLEKTSEQFDPWPFADEGPCVRRADIEKRQTNAPRED